MLFVFTVFYYFSLSPFAPCFKSAFALCFSGFTITLLAVHSLRLFCSFMITLLEVDLLCVFLQFLCSLLFVAFMLLVFCLFYILFFLFLYLSFFSQLFVRPTQTTILPFWISFSWKWFWSLPSVQCHKPPSIVLQALHQI